MQILITNLITFDEQAERERILTAFKGEQRIQTKLLAILEAFVTCNWYACHSYLRQLSRDELEFVHGTIYDVMRARADRHGRTATTADAPPLEGGLTSGHYPQFKVGAFVD